MESSSAAAYLSKAKDAMEEAAADHPPAAAPPTTTTAKASKKGTVYSRAESEFLGRPYVDRANSSIKEINFPIRNLRC